MLAMVAAVPAIASPASQRYDQAAEELARGQIDRAAAGFVRAAELEPDGELAADALFSAATLYEDRLARPGKALELYRRVVQTYPNDRVSRAASRRLEGLASQLGSESDRLALAGFKRLLSDYPRVGREDSIDAARKLLQRYPQWMGRYDAHLWLATKLRETGALGQAQTEVEAALAAASTDDQRFRARRRLLELAIVRGHLYPAEELADELEASGHPSAARVAVDARAAINRAYQREVFYLASIAALVITALALLLSLVLTGRGRSVREVLWPPPIEVLYSLPVLLVVQVMAFTAHQDLAPAVAIITAAGIGLSWLSGAALRAGKRSIGRTAVHLGLTLVGVVSAVYLAVHTGGLIDQIVETVRFGPDV
ncbi:MAG: soluble NSF attachment family protein [Deltaproteobacteria bacterium]|nr:soluble NSF attachment family protein [Deltaproteobacteria bacterium]